MALDQQRSGQMSDSIFVMIPLTLSGGLQDAYSSVDGSAYASTMCVGNLRSGMACLSAAIRTRDRTRLQEAGKYGSIILLFALGAGAGNLLTRYMGTKTIWISCGLLMVSCLLMAADRRLKSDGSW